MMNPEEREKEHRRSERMIVTIEELRRDLDAHRQEYLDAHNHEHKPVRALKE